MENEKEEEAAGWRDNIDANGIHYTTIDLGNERSREKKEEKNSNNKLNQIHCTNGTMIQYAALVLLMLIFGWCCCCYCCFDVVAIYFIHAPIDCDTFAFSIKWEIFVSMPFGLAAWMDE